MTRRPITPAGVHTRTCADVPPPEPAPPSAASSTHAPPYLTTKAAAAYCGFKTTGATRKAHFDGRLFPVGKRGGRGTWMWAIADLDRFLRGEPPATLHSDRSGASPRTRGAR